MSKQSASVITRFNRDNHGAKPDDTKSMKQSFTVNIRPKAKERPRFANGHVYTPQGTRDFESVIANTARSAGCRPVKNPCVIAITATFKRPKGMKSFEYCTKRPDVDNLAKSVTDGMNGVAYADDAQIVELLVSKNYGMQDMIEVEIEYLD